MLSLLNRYQLLRDEFLFKDRQNKIPRDEILKFSEMEENLLMTCLSSQYSFEKTKQFEANEVPLLIIQSNINNPDKEKQSDLERMIAFFYKNVKPLRD